MVEKIINEKGNINMSKRTIISLAGDLGSGKSTIASMISEILSYPIHRNGDFFRAIGKKMVF